MDIYRQITEKLTSSDFMIYGHSMGAYLALKVCNMLEKINKMPVALIVSGNPGPGIRDDKKRYLLGKEDFIKELKKLGGIPTELIEDKESLSFFEPILRADFEISEKNEVTIEHAVNTPLFAMMGSLEDDVAKITNWAGYTRAGFNYEILEGDHFFIHKHPDRIAQLIKDCYDKGTLLQ